MFKFETLLRPQFWPKDNDFYSLGSTLSGNTLFQQFKIPFL